MGQLSDSRRITCNVIATYGRSLYALVVGLFTARWVLMTLGEVDFGLYGVVGGLTAFVSFLNGLLAMAVGRFYAFAVGEAKKPGNEKTGLVECQRWFTTAVTLHTLVPLVLVAVGYPVGVWMVENFLTIPPDRVSACLWVWRCVTVTCFVAMVNVPYQAMYTAKQNIAELTIYSFVTTTLNCCVLYFMVTHPADWLARYAAWMMLSSVVPQIIIGVRAYVIYPECRFRRDAFGNWKYIKPVLSFAGFRLLNGISMIAANQGQAVVVNKYLGATANAAINVGNQVTGQCQTLATAFAGALYPAITNAAGAGRLDEMRTLALRASKYATLALLIFVIPLSLEIRPVLDLWLKTPPAFAAELCVWVLAAATLERLTEGHWMAVFAVGRIAGYQTVACFPSFFALALGWLFVAKGMGVVGVGMALAISKIAALIVRLYYGRKEAGLAARIWFKKVFAPILIATGVAILGGVIGQRLFNGAELNGILKIAGVSACCELVFLPFVWKLVLSQEERNFIIHKICRYKFYLFLYQMKMMLGVQITRLRHRATLRRVRERARQGGRIRVAFLVHISSKWKCQSLYDWLAKEPMFEPVVQLDHIVKGSADPIDFERERAFYEAHGCKVMDPTYGKLDADIVFYQEPGSNIESHLPQRVSSYALTFYIPYYVATHDTWQFACSLPYFHGFLFRQIVPSKAWAEYYHNHVNRWNYGGKLLGLGHTMLDNFKAIGESSGKYTIYAPHFSFPVKGMKCWVPISTFPDTGKLILVYAQKHPEMNWVFKPHPRLKYQLIETGFMSKEEITSYYAAWEELGTACYTGDYPRYFNDARAMITDCSSFLGEFAATGKPLIHLLTKDNVYPPAPIAEKLFASFYQVKTEEDFSSVLRLVLEEGKDPKREERLAAAKEIGFFGRNAADTIGNYIKKLIMEETDE